MYNHSLSPFNNYFQVVIRLLVSMVNLKFNRDVSHGDSWHLSFPPGRFDDRRSTLAEGHGDFTIWMSSWDLGWYGTILEWNKIWILPWDWNMISMGKRWCLAWCLPWCLPSDVDEFCWVFFRVLHVAAQATRRDSWRPGFGALEPVDDYSHLMGFKHQHVGTEVGITDKCWLVDF